MKRYVPLTAGVSETAACPPSPAAADPSDLSSPTSSPSSRQSSPACSLEAGPCTPACCIYVLLYFSSYCTVRLKKLSSFLYLFLFMYYWCDKYYKPITVKNYIAHSVNWVPRPALLDLTNWTYKHALRDRTHVYVRDLL